MLESKLYNENFYDEHNSGAYSSANVIIPIINDVFRPASVIDIGCGNGQWLKVWREKIGVEQIQGVEGPYVSKLQLQVPKDLILFQDLKEPLSINKRFDLAMSLEVAEHLPASVASRFVEDLTRLSDVVLFSASMIGQDGQYHINEQLPEYWAKIFSGFGYVPVDYLRPLIWNREDVQWWYRQNTLIYIKKEKLEFYPALQRAYENTDPNYLLRIQPWLYFYKHDHVEKTRSVIGYLKWKLYPLKKLLLGKK